MKIARHIFGTIQNENSFTTNHISVARLLHHAK